MGGKKGKKVKGKGKSSGKRTKLSESIAPEALADDVEKIAISNPAEQLSNPQEDPQLSTSSTACEHESKYSGSEGESSDDLGALQPTVLFKEFFNPEVCSNWHKPKRNKIPSILFHRSHETYILEEEIQALGVKFRLGKPTQHYLKYYCLTFMDHVVLTNYFVSKNLPFHTFATPDNYFMKVVIKGVPHDVDIKKLKNIFKQASIPVKRMHKMHVKEITQKNLMILVVLYNNPQWKRIFTLKSINGHNVILEPLAVKILQCHRCQKWGHTRRYCNGMMACVKCAQEHDSKDCTKDPTVDIPKCANCYKDHTANYKKCDYYPGSQACKVARQKKFIRRLSKVNNDIAPVRNGKVV